MLKPYLRSYTVYSILPLPSQPWYFTCLPPPSFTRFRDKRVSSPVSLSETPGPFHSTKILVWNFGNSTCPMELTFRSDGTKWPDRSKWTTFKAGPEYSGRTKPKWSVSFDVRTILVWIKRVPRFCGHVWARKDRDIGLLLLKHSDYDFLLHFTVKSI